MSALDELVRSWRANPDPEGTIAVCVALGASGRRDLMDEVRGVADAWHTENFDVMLAVGRMFLDAGALVEAQAAFVLAGKADGRRPEAFRFLGEVLLRRGDAERAEKVFERAARLGAHDGDLRIWHDRARVYTSLQKRLGLEAVAREILRTVPRTTSAPPPAMSKQAAPPPRVGPAVPTEHERGARAPSVARAQSAASFDAQEPPTQPVALPLPPAAFRPPEPARVPPPAMPAKAPPPAARPVETESMSPVEVPSAPAFAPAAAPKPDGGALAAVHADDGAEIPPHEVLSQLVQVGVFEPEGGVVPAWEKSPRESSKRLWVLGVAAGLAAAGALGGSIYARRVAEGRRAEAAAIGDKVAVELGAGSPEAIARTDGELSRAFDLDPARPRTSLLWLENRVMHWLVRGSSQGIEGAIQRARSLDLPPESIVFGSLAIRLAEGDVSAALSLLPTWDEKAKRDGVYQMLAGLALERTGSPECLKRYDAALAADEQLRLARVLRARALLLIRGPEALSEALAGIDPNSQEAKALTVLSALLEPQGAEGAANLDSVASSIDAEKLAVPLRWIGEAYKARAALTLNEKEKARGFIAKALDAADTPDAAVRLASLALAADDRSLLNKATLRAVALSPVHVPARLLVARLALENGHKDEALKAVDGIDPKLPDVVSLRAVVAYERGDAVALGDALDALPSGESPSVTALRLLPALLVGGALPKDLDASDLAQPEVLWGRQVALDVLLRRGDLKGAAELLGRLDASQPPLALRRARLRRLALEQSVGDRTGKARAPADAGAASLASCAEDSLQSLSAGPSLLALTERVECLLVLGDGAAARALLEQYPAVFGAMGGWLAALVDVAQDRVPRAKARLAALELPQGESPLALRVVVVRALIATGDRKRGQPLLAELRKLAPQEPAVAALPARF